MRCPRRCCVSRASWRFSEGRDSSLLLAVAADLAEREGLAPPVAVTFRYFGDPAADEAAWQELVVAHLHRSDLQFDWVRRAIATELDNVGPLMALVLRAHGGPTFPAGLANMSSWLSTPPVAHS